MHKVDAALPYCLRPLVAWLAHLVLKRSDWAPRYPWIGTGSVVYNSLQGSPARQMQPAKRIDSDPRKTGQAYARK